MSLTQKTVRAGLWSTLQGGGRQIIGTLIFLALARFYLDKDEFGLVALSNVLIMFLNIVVRQGLTTAIIQRSKITEKHINTAFWMNVIVGLIVAGCTATFAHPISILLGEPRTAPILQALSAGVIFTSLSLIPEALLSRHLDFKTLAVRTLVSTICGGSVALILAALGAGVWSLVALSIVTSAVGVLVLWRAISWKPKLEFETQSLKELMGVSLNVTGIGLIGYTSRFIDQFIIGTMLGVGSLGLYYVAQRLVKTIQEVLTQGINTVVIPSFSKVIDDKERVKRGFVKLLSLSSALIFPTFVGLLIVADDAVSIIFGEKWIELGGVLKWLCVASVFQSITNNGTALIAIGESSKALILNLISAFIMLLLGIIGSQVGLIGVVIGFTVRNLIMAVIWVIVLQRIIGLAAKEFMRPLWQIGLSTALMSISVLLLNLLLQTQTYLHEITALLLIVLLGGIVYALSIIIFAPQLTSFLKQQISPNP